MTRDPKVQHNDLLKHPQYHKLTPKKQKEHEEQKQRTILQEKMKETWER